MPTIESCETVLVVEDNQIERGACCGTPGGGLQRPNRCAHCGQLQERSRIAERFLFPGSEDIMALDDGEKIADVFERCYDKATNQFDWSKLRLSEFEPVLEARANDDRLNFKQDGCTAEYRARSQEIATWELGIMMAEYTARLLAKKAEDGHCDKEKPSPMHVGMLGKFRASIESLLKQIKKREESLRPPAISTHS
jgi:hypothetical protein